MSIVTLSLHGSPAPSTFAVGSTSELLALVDGSTPLSVEWSYGLRTGPRTAGVGPIVFQPAVVEPHYLHVVAVKANGASTEAVFIFTVTATGSSGATVSIVWADPAPRAAGPNSAHIYVSGATPPRSIAWTHYANGASFGSGSGAAVALGNLQPGIHRIFATVVDAYGHTVVGNGSIHVPASFGLQSAVVPPQPMNSSLVYLGSVFSPVIEGSAVTATELPFLLTSFDTAVKLIPGSTHFRAELDDELNAVDDEVVVRTQLGNWTLKGPPTGLTDETLPYDYQHEQPFQPAPLDLSAHYGVDVWNVHGANVSAFKFRVRFRCFVAGDAVYRYTPCEWSSYSGGTGERQRRLLAVVSNVDFSLDDETPQNRGLSRNEETFTAPNQGFIQGNFETTGQPDRPVNAEDHFYTDQNIAAVYESDDLPEVEARATYGMPSVRPCIVDYSQPGTPRIINKPKRLHGKLLLYLAGGAFTRGTVVRVRILTGRLPGYVDVVVPITQNVYNPDYTGFVKAGEAAIEVPDYEFSRLGLVMNFTVDESNAGTAAPPVDPMMTVGEDFYFTKLKSPAIRIDTACFRDPVLMPTFTGTFLGSAVALESCNTLACGPIGTYCYVEVSGTGTYQTLQPLGFPAPFVAPYGDEAHCYGNPTFMGEYFGGSSAQLHPRVIGYTGTTGCGSAYQYNPCSAAVQQQLAIVYPLATTPHAAVSYQDQCYTLIGAVRDMRNLVGITATDVVPVTGCTDIVCTGSNSMGGSLDYIDQETLQQVTVSFPHLDRGVPVFAAAPEKVSQGYGATPPGEKTWALWNRPVFPLFTAPEDATIDFEVTPATIWREIVVTHNGVRSHYRFYPGLAKGSISVQAGDAVTLEFARGYEHNRGTSGTVKWSKPVPVPYLYDSAVVNIPGVFGTLTALGFCGLSSRQDYCFYGTMGATVEMDLPNPDSIVTVKDNSPLPEMVVVRTKQPHEADVPFNMPSYQAQRLKSPLTLKFYASRTRLGAHGEMDVWFNRDGASFPQYLKVSDFKALAIADYAYRKLSVQSDTARRGLRVITAAQAMELHSPRIHVDDRGRNVSVVTEELNDFVFDGDQPYTFTGNFDTGISETIYRNLRPGGGPVLQQLWSVPAKPRGVCYVASQDEVWVACPDASVVAIFSGDGTVIKALVPVSNMPYSVTHCVDTDSVAICCMSSGFVEFLDATTRLSVNSVDIAQGPFYTAIPMLISYNPVSQNVYVAGVPTGTFDLGVFEVDPRTSIVRAFPFNLGAVGLSDLFYCQTTMETIVAVESGGCWAFNVSTTVAENLGVPTSTCRGACDVPQYRRVLFSTAANPPNGQLFTYDPVSRKVIRATPYSNPVRATGWHPLRRKYYLSTLSIFSGGPGVGIVDINGVRLLTLDNLDWGFQWVYSPISRLMFNSIPATFFSNNYVGIYT